MSSARAKGLKLLHEFQYLFNKIDSEKEKKKHVQSYSNIQ